MSSLSIFFAVKVDGSDVIVGTAECFNIQTRHKFENFCLFSLIEWYLFDSGSSDIFSVCL